MRASPDRGAVRVAGRTYPGTLLMSIAGGAFMLLAGAAIGFPSAVSAATQARGVAGPIPLREPPPLLRFVLHYRTTASPERREVFGFGAEVVWTLGRGAGVPAVRPSPTPVSSETMPTIPALSLVLGVFATPPAVVAPEPSLGPEDCPAAQGALPEEVLGTVPGVDLVRVWTLQEADLAKVDTRSLLAAARARGALPTIRLRAGYDDDDRVDRDAFERLEDHREVSSYSIDMQLEWDLAELASGVDTYRAVREGRAQLELRHALATQAVTVYFDRLRLAVDDAVRCEDAVDVVRERRLRLKELDATLNGLTGGRWGDATYRDAPVAPAPKQTSSDPAPSEPTP